MLRIKEIMKEKGVTAQDLAVKLNVTTSCISRYINGNPTVSTLYKLAEALGVSVTELFDSDRNEVEGYVLIRGKLYKLQSANDLQQALDAVRQKE